MKHTELYQGIIKLVNELQAQAINGNDAARDDLHVLHGYVEQAAKDEQEARELRRLDESKRRARIREGARLMRIQ